jgi:hypothetical protein
MNPPPSITILLTTLLLASTAHATDVDLLLPLRGWFLSLILLAVLVPTLPLAPVAAVAGLYALFGERRVALGLGTLLLTATSLAGIAVLVTGLGTNDPSNNQEAMAAIVMPVPLTAMLLWRGMIRHWTADKKTTAGITALVIGGAFFIGELLYWRTLTHA